ncbi:MAG TPA: hypothetical protein VFB96_01185, partial [Pirellulaceae bacterium]|nr:hypothetical protein [Pirellulaceae bacterium]
MIRSVIGFVPLMLSLIATTLADEPAKKPGGYRLLMITQSAGFKHGSVTRKDDKLAPAEQAVTEIG